MTEPHSLTLYLVRRAVSWSGKSLMELMQAFIYELLGVQEGS